MIILHDLDNPPKKEFERLHAALMYARDNKVTGYIVVGGEVIDLKKGKRKGIKKGTWVAIQ